MEIFSCHPPWQLRMAWSLAAFFAFFFGGVPWLMLLKPGVVFHPGMLILVLWTALPWTLTGFLVFHAWSRIEIEFQSKRTLLYRRSLLGFCYTKEYVIDKVTQVSLYYPGKSNSYRIRKTIFVYENGKKRWLVDELACNNIPALFQWITDRTEVKALKIERRNLYGGL